MSYREVTVSVQPGEEYPKSCHSDEFYCHKEAIKTKGRKKKTDPTDFRMIYVPWGDINDTELTDLATYGLKPGSIKEMGIWRVSCRGLSRSELIGIIRGLIDPKSLESNPTHIARDRLSNVMYSNWSYIHSQIKCHTFCWECSDVKTLECILENRDMLRGEEI